jgi:hypothetical protein
LRGRVKRSHESKNYGGGRVKRSHESKNYGSNKEQTPLENSKLYKHDLKVVVVRPPPGSWTMVKKRKGKKAQIEVITTLMFSFVFSIKVWLDIYECCKSIFM